ncbi:NUDIX hydrolase [Rhodoplanes elegans]|nr:NUDIX hydrolase [Rhodoplanes elegans]
MSRMHQPLPRPEIVAISEIKNSPWVVTRQKSIRFAGRAGIHDYHSFAQADYVSSLVVAEDGTIPLVEQYRPAVEKFTLELPGGLHDTAGIPAEAAVRELREETGLTAVAPPIPLGNLMPDSGRLENRLWGFFINAGARANDWNPEDGIVTHFVSKRQLRELIASGEFDHALHIALIGLAVMYGHFAWD